VSIVREKNFKNCADGRVKKEYLLSDPFTKETACSFSSFGSANVMEFLKKPFFTLVRPPSMNMRAVLGENTLEVWYEPADLPFSEPVIYRLLEGDPVVQDPS
jgi:hypothetical protein